MPLADYFKGPRYKAEAARLQADLDAQRLKAQLDYQALQEKYNTLKEKAKEVGALNLIEVQAQIKTAEDRLASLHAHVDSAQLQLESVRSQLTTTQQQILGAEDTIQLESFGPSHIAYGWGLTPSPSD